VVSAWPEATLADVATVVGRGITPRYGDKGVVVFNQKCVRKGRLGSASARIHDIAQKAVPTEKLLRSGDVLVNSTGTGTLGRTAAVRHLDGPATVDSHITIVRPNLGTDPGWLAYALSFAEPQIVAMAEGSTGQTELSRARLGALYLVVPSLVEQRAIASILGALDDKIESNHRVTEVALDLLDAIAAREAADLPRVALGSLALISRAVVDPSTLGDLKVWHYSLPAFDAGARPERVLASNVMSNKVALDGPAVLISRLNPRFNRTWWVSPNPGVSFASPEFAMLQASGRQSLAGVWLAVRDEAFRERITERVTGTSGSHQRIRHDDLLTVETFDARRLSRDVLDQALSLLDRIESLRAESDAMAEVRDALLPELLSGRVRVPLEVAA
jgi:type I restriction enzyme S subunit